MKRTSLSELDDFMDQLGVKAGSKVMVHAFLPSLGIIEGGISAFYEKLMSKLGPQGTLVVPTFSASYRRGETYDVAESKSINGSLSEFVRQQEDAVRSLCPLFSMAAVGPDSESLMLRPSKSCFGKGSVYEKIFDHDFLFLCLGIDWNQGYSFFMHLERLASISTRKECVFHGKTKLLNGSLIEDSAIHFVRREDMDWSLAREYVGEDLVKQGIFREVKFGGSLHRSASASSLKSVVLDKLAEDPMCMTNHAVRK